MQHWLNQLLLMEFHGSRRVSLEVAHRTVVRRTFVGLRPETDLHPPVSTSWNEHQ